MQHTHMVDLPTVSAHYLQDKSPLVTAEQHYKVSFTNTRPFTCTSAYRQGKPLGRGGDGIHYLYDAMQGRVRANGHVCATEVVVY